MVGVIRSSRGRAPAPPQYNAVRPAIQCHQPSQEGAMARRGFFPAAGALMAACLAARITAAADEHPPHIEPDNGRPLMHETLIFRPVAALRFRTAGSFTVDAVIVAAGMQPGDHDPRRCIRRATACSWCGCPDGTRTVVPSDQPPATRPRLAEATSVQRSGTRGALRRLPWPANRGRIHRRRAEPHAGPGRPQAAIHPPRTSWSRSPLNRWRCARRAVTPRCSRS
jgi:hypothetical protein